MSHMSEKDPLSAQHNELNTEKHIMIFQGSRITEDPKNFQRG